MHQTESTFRSYTSSTEDFGNFLKIAKEGSLVCTELHLTYTINLNPSERMFL